MNQLDPDTLKNLYDWLDTIPFSRSKKNLARDFSDAVLTAELVKAFFPAMVDLHNYPGTHSLRQKIVNWSTINNKVLKKLDCLLPQSILQDLATAKREVVEQFLQMLREKIQAKTNAKTVAKKRAKAPTKTHVKDPDLLEAIGDSLRNESLVRGKLQDEMVPRELFDQKVEQLLKSEETIRVLTARIERLEATILLKDMKIERLTASLDRLKANPNESCLED
ncbi:sperm flagellar protein 1-like [Uloborus diversus]|uniref:sperm flagellar protein 1-like n=1 Tax=Uloborus diversus TaxID=327109 RepID=UPI0024097661|nr:sperm flagellar protein 1-like [Uloborus diversus]